MQSTGKLSRACLFRFLCCREGASHLRVYDLLEGQKGVPAPAVSQILKGLQLEIFNMYLEVAYPEPHHYKLVRP